MARTNLPVTTMTPNSAVLNQAGTAIDQANGMNIQLSSTSFPAPGGADTLILYVQNTAASTQTVTVRKGVGWPAAYGAAFESGKGDLTTGNLTASTGTAFIGPFEVARYAQSDGSLNIDFSSGMTGTIWALLTPKRF